MGLFKKLKKAFKKVTGFVKKTVKKVVKGVKKVAKKIGSSKILKALAIAAAVVVTGGAAIGAFTGGAGVAGATKLGQFANWAMNASKTVTSGSLFGSAAGKKGVSKFLTQAGNFATKTVAKPFGAIGTTAGNIAAGVTDFTGLTTEASRTGLSTEELSYFNEGDILAQEGSVAAKDASSFAETVVNPSTGIETVKTSFFDTTAGKVVSDVGTAVGTNVLTGAAMQAIQGEPELRGSMSGAAYEGAEFMDPLKVYAAQQGISTDSIYQHMMYGNADPSSMYGNELYRQQTVGIA
jgi:hypothetical protein